MSKYNGQVPGEEPFDEERWRQDPMDDLYNHNTLLAYMLQGSDQLRPWNRGNIGDPVLICLIEMGLWNGTYPDNKFTFDYRHSTTVATRLLPCIMNLEKQVGDGLSEQ